MAHLYRLVSSDGQLTERRLRTLLMATPEWARAAAGTSTRPSDAWRMGLDIIDAASGEKESTPAQNRQRQADAEMRKLICLQLAHQWRYKSDCWSKAYASSAAGLLRRSKRRAADGAGGEVRLSDEQQAAQDLQLLQQRQQAVVGLFDRTFTAVQTAQGQVAGLLMPHISAAARAWTGPRSAAHYGRARGKGMTWLRVRSTEGALEVARWLEGVCTLRLAALRSWRDALGEDGARALAYAVPDAFSAPESELDALRYVVEHSRAVTDANAAAVRLQHGGALPSPEAAWVEDYYAGHNAVVAMVNTAHAVMARYRMEPLRMYLAAAEAVLDGLRVSSRTTRVAIMQRLEWVTEAATAQGPAAGERDAAKKAIPPLVDRLCLTNDDTEHGVRLLALATTPPPPGEPLPRFVIARSAN